MATSGRSSILATGERFGNLATTGQFTILATRDCLGSLATSGRFPILDTSNRFAILPLVAALHFGHLSPFWDFGH